MLSSTLWHSASSRSARAPARSENGSQVSQCGSVDALSDGQPGTAAAAGFGGPKRHRVRRGKRQRARVHGVEQPRQENLAAVQEVPQRRVLQVLERVHDGVQHARHQTHGEADEEDEEPSVVAPVDGLPPEPLAVHRAVAGVVLERLDLRLLRRARIGAGGPRRTAGGAVRAAAAQAASGVAQLMRLSFQEVKMSFQMTPDTSLIKMYSNNDSSFGWTMTVLKT